MMDVKETSVMEKETFRSGFVGIVGRPNVGKSTLLNCILGEKLAITSHKPQTTRNRITGIKHMTGGQIIFIDTPGLHQATNPLHHTLVKSTLTTLADVDVVLVVLDVHAGITEADRDIVTLAASTNHPFIVAVNKMDCASPKHLSTMIEHIRNAFPTVQIHPLSALTGHGVAGCIEEIYRLLPEGPPYFPPDMITDRSERFLAAEIIREKVMAHTHEEVPYATAVTVDLFKEDTLQGVLRIMATITVERPQQKRIIIGAGGSKLKQIGIDARRELESRFGIRVYLSLFVRVRKQWTRNEKWLKEFGYRE